MRTPTNRILFYTALSLFIPLLIVPTLHARTFPHIVAFGDSLTDHEGARSIIEPSEIDFIVPEAWTNCPESGPCVWVEYMAEKWGATIDNNAIGGALTDGHESEDIETAIDLGLLPPLGLIGRVDEYVDDAPAFDPNNTLFSVWIGANDLLEFSRGQSDAATPEALITDAIGNIQTALNELAVIGAQHFLILSLPDISQSPRFISRTTEERAAAQALVQSFNTALENAVNNFDAANPAITVYRFNVFSFLNSAMQDGTFANTTGTLLVDPDDPAGAVNEPVNDYLFWDEIHPTTRAHGLLGDAVAESVEDRDDDDDDDDNTCFIAVASGTGRASSSWMTVVLFAVGMGMAAMRGLHSKNEQTDGS